MKSKKLVLNRETVRALSVQEMQNVAGGGSSFFTSTQSVPVASQHCGLGGENGTGTGTGKGNMGTKYCTVK